MPTPLDLLIEGDFEELQSSVSVSGRTYHAGFFQVIREQIIMQHKRQDSFERDCKAKIESLLHTVSRQDVEIKRLSRRIMANKLAAERT